MEEMLEGHVTGKDTALDFTDNKAYSSCNTTKWG
jgi:hypothetical protein